MEVGGGYIIEIPVIFVFTSRTVFNLFDVNGDGGITFEELGVVLRSMGQNPSDQELIEMINELDEDDSGTVDFEEFVTLMVKKTADDEFNDDIEEAFRVFDTKNDGYFET